ncbi:MAG: oligosaccharide flippase family protein [bacterium]
MSSDDSAYSVKKLFNQTIIYGIGLIVSKTINFILLPLYTNFFSSEELGLYNLVYSIWAFSMVFYSVGLETSFLKFFIERNNKDSKTDVYSSTLIGTAITSLFFSAILFILSFYLPYWLSFSNPEKGVRLIQLVSFVMLFDLLYRFPLLLLRCELRAKMFIFISNLFFISNLLLNIFFIIILKYNVEAIFYSYLISSIIALVCGLFVTKDFIEIKFDSYIFKKMVILGSNFILMGFFLIVIEQSDRFFLNYFYDESVVGIYSTCYRLGSILLLAIMAFKLSWTPYFLNIAKDSKSKVHIAKIFTYFIFTGLLMFLFFFLFLDDIVRLNIFGFEIINRNFWSGLKIVPAILLSFFFWGLYLNFSVIPLFTEKPVYLIWITLAGCLLNLALNFILIPRYEILGAAFATLISYIFMFVVLYFVSQKFYFIRYEWKKIFMMSVSIIFICSINIITSTILNTSSAIFLNATLLISFLLLMNFLNVVKFNKLKLLFIKNNSTDL